MALQGTQLLSNFAIRYWYSPIMIGTKLFFDSSIRASEAFYQLCDRSPLPIYLQINGISALSFRDILLSFVQPLACSVTDSKESEWRWDSLHNKLHSLLSYNIWFNYKNKLTLQRYSRSTQREDENHHDCSIQLKRITVILIAFKLVLLM